MKLTVSKGLFLLIMGTIGISLVLVMALLLAGPAQAGDTPNLTPVPTKEQPTESSPTEETPPTQEIPPTEKTPPTDVPSNTSTPKPTPEATLPPEATPTSSGIHPRETPVEVIPDPTPTDSTTKKEREQKVPTPTPSELPNTGFMDDFTKNPIVLVLAGLGLAGLAIITNIARRKF